ncbi:MAG TPA: DUF1648 domain-containing protein [Candidatus Eremiobacteraceae bacterium]
MTTQVLIGVLCEVAGFASMVLLVGLTVQTYALLPERIATHFGFRGQPNGWGPRGVALVFPIISVIMFGTLTILNPVVGLGTAMIGPGAARNPIFSTLIVAGILVLTAAVGRAMIAYNLGQTHGLGSPPFFVALTFAALAFALAFYFEALAHP